jgi:predicted metal-dependent peptidase
MPSRFSLSSLCPLTARPTRRRSRNNSIRVAFTFCNIRGPLRFRLAEARHILFDELDAYAFQLGVFEHTEQFPAQIQRLLDGAVLVIVLGDVSGLEGVGELDEHDWDGAGDLSGDEKEELDREIDSALREGSILAGKMKGNVSRGIFELLHPNVNWKEAMRDFVKVSILGGDESTWRRPNRRMLANNLIMPNTESRKAKIIAIGVDTSGSIGGELLSMFMSEFNAICEEVMPECVELLYWDSHVAKHETYRDAEVANAVKSTKPAGGGCTEPDCVPKYLIEKRIEPQCVVMLTDGHFYGDGNWSGIDAPVLWCVKGNASFVPTVGKCVFIE